MDTVEGRKANCLKRYFRGFPYNERKKVKIIIMDLSHAFYSAMKSLFPKSSIIIDRFHYVRLLNDSLKNSRLDTCSKLSNKALAKSIKRHLHLFDKYKKT
ncbi:transposase [Thomasclavelia ramosa]|uniref:transposase n=1 Tax=Thomasclavelia ramosa TaxID=1547 RepID=UPI00355B466D